MKNPVAVIFNDLHLKTGNEQAVESSVIHMIQYMTKHKISVAIFAGDWFESRSFQRQALLILTLKLLSKFQIAGIKVHIIPGNHDKTLYGSQDSFLEVFKYHPNVEFYSSISDIAVGDLKITILPFFSDDKLVPMLEEHKGSDILISHFEMQGSTNLGKVSEKSSITRKLLRKWDMVYLGHYHNHHEITPDIIHLPSLRQNNFGEDANKGFSLLSDDGSYEIVPGSFKQFLKVVIDADESSTKDIKALINVHQNSDNAIRFEFIGSESALKSVDKGLFKGTGIDVKIKYSTKYEPGITEEPKVIEEYTADSVRDAFEIFCDDKGYDYAEGFEFLEEFLTTKKV